MPPAALHQDVNTFAVLTRSWILVKPTSDRTPAVIWLAVTPWSGAPDGLPGWQTFFRLPKSAVAACADALGVVWAPVVELRGRTSVSVIRSSQCQCTGQVGIRYPRGLLAGPGVGTVAITRSERASVAALREFAPNAEYFCPSRWAASKVLGVQIVQFGIDAQPGGLDVWVGANVRSAVAGPGSFRP
jgi:hypothetical protein